MATPVRRVHRPGKYMPKAREIPAPELPVANDTEDDVTERVTRIVPVSRSARMVLPGPRTPVRLRKVETRVEPSLVSVAFEAEGQHDEFLHELSAHLDARGIAAFGDAYTTAREQAVVDAREMLDPNDVPVEARAAITGLEGELGDERAALAASTAKTRVTIAEKGMRSLEGALFFIKNGVPELAKTGFELMNLNTKEKAYAALLEIIPTVSLWYAVTGKRVKFREGDGLSQPELEDIDKIDRILYAAGSIFFLGHVYSGVRHALVRNGAFALAKQGRILAAARTLIPAASKLMGPTVARAQQYGIRELTKDRSKPSVPSPQSEDRS